MKPGPKPLNGLVAMTAAQRQGRLRLRHRRIIAAVAALDEAARRSGGGWNRVAAIMDAASDVLVAAGYPPVAADTDKGAGT